MRRRELELKRKLAALAKPAGASVVLELDRGHFRAIAKRGAERVVVSLAGTPSDHRNNKNEDNYLRSRLRSIMVGES